MLKFCALLGLSTKSLICLIVLYSLIMTMINKKFILYNTDPSKDKKAPAMATPILPSMRLKYAKYSCNCFLGSANVYRNHISLKFKLSQHLQAD